MKHDVFAVAVGYNFGLIPAKALTDIQLRPTDSTVYIEDQYWNLHKAMTFADSRKLDDLLDKYGEHPITAHKIRPVIMSGELEMHLPGFDQDKDSLMFGGYAFRCDGKEIPFDFSGISWSIQQNGNTVSVSFETGETPFSKDNFLDDCYAEEYSKLGLRLHDITAAFLSKASSISEFMVSLELNGKEYGPENIAKLGGFSLKNLAFWDQHTEYPVKQSVLDRFNASLIQEKAANTLEGGTSENKTQWICVYKDVLGYPSDHDNLTEICVPTDWLLNCLNTEGVSFEEWCSSYTADNTEDIARKALAEGIILDCADAHIKKAIVHPSQPLDRLIQDARQKTSDSPAQDKPKAKDMDTDPPVRA